MVTIYEGVIWNKLEWLYFAEAIILVIVERGKNTVNVSVIIRKICKYKTN